MALLETVSWTDEQRQAFEDECFAAWLNLVDATMLYDERRKRGAVWQWRECFDLGYSVAEAVAMSVSTFADLA